MNNQELISLDFGGSVLKVVTQRTLEYPNLQFIHRFIYNHNNEDIELRLYSIPSQQSAGFIRHLGEIGIKEIYVTGGGSHKYQNIMEENQIHFHRIPEMQSVFEGVKFLRLMEETFIQIGKDNTKMNILSSQIEYPFILVNIGSGTSIIAMYNDTEYKRVDGTPLGGGTFVGLCKLLTNVENYEQLTSISGGDSSNFDLTVGDIYGEDEEMYKELGLKASIKASCFGKVGAGIIGKDNYSDKDAVDSVGFMISCSISQLTCLVGLRENISRIVFSGGMLNYDPIHFHLNYGAQHYSRQGIKPAFINSKYSKFTGALGCLKKMIDETNNIINSADI